MTRLTTKLRLPALALAGALATAGSAAADRLTFERIIADPPLNGPAVRGVKVAPDGARVTYQKAREGDTDILDLWQFDPESGEHSRLLRAEDLTDGPQELTEEEKARLERERIRQTGITHYSYSKTGKQLLIPLAGNLYIYDLSSGNVQELEGGQARLDPKLSPDGSSVAFVRDRNIFVRGLADGEVLQVTEDGSETVVNGLADFIAQEEMGRGTGFWWSPDNSKIAFIQYDESPVGIVERVAIGGDGASLVEQRYPLAGTDNVKVRVGIADLTAGSIIWADLGSDPDIYIPRVDWDADGDTLYVQHQPREQDRLTLLAVDPATGKAATVLTEEQDTWVNLHDDLKPLDDGSFLWSSERTGFNHIYHYPAPESDKDGRAPVQVTAGDWMVDSIACVRPEEGEVYFTGWAEDPRLKDLYAVKLDGSEAASPRKITTREGWHGISASGDCSLYVDSFSAPDQPRQLSLHEASGARLSWLLENALTDGHPYAPYLDTHVVPDYGTLDAEDGTTLYYQMTKPSDFDPNQAYPVIVSVYGGPGAQRVRKGWVSLTDQAYADHGYIVFRLDNRGAARRGHAFEDHLHRNMGDVEVRDQLTGIAWLKSLPYVRDDAIGVTGWSYGGYMAALMLAKGGSDIAAAVSGAPVTDWRLYDTHYTERYMDHPADNPDGYKESAVFAHVDGIVNPLLLIHGMADDNVVFTNATKLMQALQHRNVPFELMTYPGETHFIRNRQSRLHRALLELNFFDRHLTP